MTLPARYAYLRALDGPPRMLVEALALHGVREAAGSADNPVILAWAREAGLEAVYRHDAMAWCGLFMAVVARRAGYAPPAAPLWALNWAAFGQPSPLPSIGDVLTFTRPTPAGMAGHVGLYVGEDADCFHVLGGNQADVVSVARLARRRLHRARRPVWRIGQPAGVRPHRLPVEGPVSTHEA